MVGLVKVRLPVQTCVSASTRANYRTIFTAQKLRLVLEYLYAMLTRIAIVAWRKKILYIYSLSF